MKRPPKINLSLNKKDDKEGLVCVSCGYSGPGSFDEETHSLVCPECGANLEEGDLLKYKTPKSYQDDYYLQSLTSLDLDDDLSKG